MKTLRLDFLTSKELKRFTNTHKKLLIEKISEEHSITRMCK